MTQPDLHKPFWPKLLAKLIPLLIVLGAVAGVAIVGKLPAKKDLPQVMPPAPANVRIEEVRLIPTMADTFEIEGSVEPNTVVKVAAEVAGRIERYGRYTGPDPQRKGQQLDQGDPIQAGQPLMYLNTDLLQAAYKQAKAQYDFHLRHYKRIKLAQERDVATRKELDEARTDLDLSQAALDEIKANLDRTTIIAPVSGIINRLTSEVGEYVQPGMACAEIVDIQIVKIVVNIPEQDISYFRIGQQQDIFDRLDGRIDFRGPITYISKVAEPLARTTRVEITTSNKDRKLHSGQIVTVRMKRQDLKNVIMIPLDAIIPLEQSYMVFVVQDGKAQPIKNITIDIRSIKGKRIRVLSGLSGGELLIVQGNRMCGPGQQVRIVGRQSSQPNDPLTAEAQNQEK